MKCMYCDAEIKEGSRFCAKCGKDLSAPGSTGNPPSTSRNKAPFIVGGIIALVAVAAVAVALVFFIRPHHDEQSFAPDVHKTPAASLASESSSVEYVVTFDGKGASAGSMSPLICAHGESVVVPECGFTFDGHEFVQWEDAQKLVYKPGDSVKVMSDLELFAVWKPSTCVVKFLGAGASGGSVDTMSVVCGEDIALPSCGYYRDGYEFDRWVSESGTTYRPGDAYRVKSDETFSVQWVAKQSSTPLPTSSLSPQTNPSASDSESAPASRYEVVKKDITWTEACAECVAKGGHLVTITSQEEMDTVASMAEQAGIDFVWLGGTVTPSGIGANGQWITGESFEYDAWYEGEPSHYDEEGRAETYIEMWRFKSTGEWSWNDDCDNPMTTPESAQYMTGNMGYVCEYED